MTSSRSFFAALFLLICSSGGCAPDGRADVSGEVKFDNKPLNEGLVSFRPTAGTSGPEFSANIVDGKYHVAIPVLPGKYAVAVRSWQKTGRIAKSPFGEQIDEIVNVIPKSYWGSQTKLSANLVVGENQFNFDVSR